jgi:hypothetical protein
MSALYADGIPKEKRFAPPAWRDVSWGDLGRDRTRPVEKTRVVVHVQFTDADGVHPENFGFDVVQRGARWWMLGISHVD